MPPPWSISIHVRTVKTGNIYRIWSRIIPAVIPDVTSFDMFKSTRSSMESNLPCVRDDMTMVDECKQGTHTSNTHVREQWISYEHIAQVWKCEYY